MAYTWPVAGFTTSYVEPEAASTGLPSMRLRKVCVMRRSLAIRNVGG